MAYRVPIETTPVGRPVQMAFVARLCLVRRLVRDASLSPVEMAPVRRVSLRCSRETYSCPAEMPSFSVRHLFPVEMLSVRLISRLTPVERPLACCMCSR